MLGVGNYTGSANKSWSITKANYDFSGVTFNDVTVSANGKAHSITVSGNLPYGIIVSYDGNGKTEAGTYTVTATFIGEADNYNTIPTMSATLKILVRQKSDKTGSRVWLIILLLLLLLIVGLVTYRIAKNKKAKKGTKTYSFAFFALAMALPISPTNAAIILGVLCVCVGLLNVHLFFNDHLLKIIQKKKATTTKSNHL